jgi:probable phosphoglycerate mutase
VTPTPPTRLVLVRHGESNTTVARVIGGHRTCSGLSSLGRLQAERLRDRLAESGEISADVLVSSAYARARQTAEIIAPALGDLVVVEEAGFGEHDPGPECDGLTYADFEERYGPAPWEHDPYLGGFPGGETIAEFQLRVHVALSRLLREHVGGTIVVACHGGVVDAVLRRALRAPATGGFELYTRNASLTELELVRPGRWRVHRYNDAAHLSGLPAASASAPAAS